MKILVTGGAGFIGSQLVDALIEAGHKVAIVDNLVTGLKEYLNPGADFYKLDINDPKLDEVFAKIQPDFVFHLAAQIDVRKSVEDPEFDNQINVLGGIKVLENCLKYSIKKIIFVSTGGALYGEAEIIPTPEDYPTYPLSPYGIHKLTLEKYLYYYYQVFSLPYTILRLANVYGPRQYKGGEAGVIAIFSEQTIKGLPAYLYGDGKQTRDYVFVKDVVAALLSTLEIDYIGAINIGTGQENDLISVIRAIEESAGQKLNIVYQAVRKGECRCSALDNSLAKKILNWSPQFNLAEGIKETIAWTKEKREK